MIRLIASRLLGMAIAIIGASFLAFVFMRVFPGNPARLILGPLVRSPRLSSSHMTWASTSRSQQYWRYISGFVTGGWGFSYSAGPPVRTVIGQRLPATLELVLSRSCSQPAAFVAAVAATYRRRPSLDRVRGSPTSAWERRRFGSVSCCWYPLTRAGIFPGPDGRLSSTATPPPQVTGLYTVDALLAGDWTPSGTRGTLSCRR